MWLTKVGAAPADGIGNPTYTGKMRYKDELHAGEHEAIIDQELFDKVQKQLKLNGRTGGAEVRNKYGALLRGLLRCKHCGTAMTHTFCGKNKRNFYRYYRCTHAMKNGHEVCPNGTLPAGEIERVVIDEVRGLTTDEALLAQVLSDAHAAIDAEHRQVRGGVKRVPVQRVLYRRVEQGVVPAG
jgi:site-specific DNA recombinase